MNGEPEKKGEGWFLPMSRTMEGWSTENLFTNLASYIPDYRRTKPELDPIRAKEAGKDLWPIVELLATFAGYDSLFLRETRRIWTQVADAPLVWLGPEEGKNFHLYRFYPQLDFAWERNGISNLMILAARQWEEYIHHGRKIGNVTYGDATINSAYPYAIGHPRLEMIFQEMGAIETPLYYQQEKYLQETQSYAYLLRQGVSFSEVFLPIRPLPNGTGLLMMDPIGKKYAISSESIGNSVYLGRPYLSQLDIYDGHYINEYVEGINLAGKKYGLGYVLSVAPTLLALVEELHEKGYVHHDLQAKNILRTPTGDYLLMGFTHLKKSTSPADRTKDLLQLAATLKELWNGRTTQIERQAQQFLRILNQRPLQLSQLAEIKVGFLEGVEYTEIDERKVILNLDLLEQVEELGEGSYGVVYLARDPTGQEYALKIESKLEAEDKVLSQVSRYPNCNPNLSCEIASFYYYEKYRTYEDWELLPLDEYQREKINLPIRGTVYQLIRGKSLQTILVEIWPAQEKVREEAKKNHLPAPVLQKVSAAQIPSLLNWLVSTVVQLHQRGYQHNDIAPRNIMIEGPGQYKLIDFGHATPLKDPYVDYEAISNTIESIQEEIALDLPSSVRQELFSYPPSLIKLLMALQPYPQL